MQQLFCEHERNAKTISEIHILSLKLLKRSVNSRATNPSTSLYVVNYIILLLKPLSDMSLNSYALTAPLVKLSMITHCLQPHCKYIKVRTSLCPFDSPTAHSGYSVNSNKKINFLLLWKINNEGPTELYHTLVNFFLETLILAFVKKCVILTTATLQSIFVPESYTRKVRKEEL